MGQPQEAVSLEDRPIMPEPNGRFEDECIDLLCKQESTLSALGEATSQRRELDSLDLARKMLLQFLDFAELHFPEEQLHQVGRRLHEINQRTREYERMVDAQSFKMIKQFVGISVPAEKEVGEAHEKLRDDYVELYNEFFQDCVPRFTDDSVIRCQFLQSVETFLCELVRKW